MGTSKRDIRASGDLVMAPRVPHGLAAAVEGLTREVIRHRPEDIYVFAAQHFEELLKLRDEYGAARNLPGKSTNTAALREMNKTLKKRTGVEKSGPKTSKERQQGGWSMNETARVLERHRSIFGDKGRKVSPEEVRALGNEKENKSRRSRDDLERFASNVGNQKRRGSNERFVRRKIPPNEPDPGENKSGKSDSSGNPKIISQIPTLTQSTTLLAKDIKSELRKNRNSSRDGRNVRKERVEIANRQSGTTRKTLTRSSHERSLDKLLDAEIEADVNEVKYGEIIVTDNQNRKTESIGRSRSFAKMPRTLSMDRVREFVVEKFRVSESWEDLRSTNYVDRVQEVIDEASPSILRRVKELSTRSAGRSRGYESVDESTSTSTRSDKSNQTDDVRSRSAMSASRRSRRSTRRTKSKTKSKTSGADSLEGIETLASETDQPKDIRNEIDPGIKLKKNIPNGLSGESDASEYADLIRKASASSGISLPAVRPPSSKNPSRSVSRSDSDNLVLPPIPPEAPRSAKHREELVLPSLQVPKEVVRGVESILQENFIEDEDAAELDLPDAPTDEIFKDSLNVTPEMAAASPRPDSLEPEDNIAELKSKLDEISSGNAPGDQEAQGNDGVKERLREIEETEKRIEKILRTETQESSLENQDAASVEEKLIEIQEAEERLKDILDLHADLEDGRDSNAEEIQKDVADAGMKEKLIEIQETEKRIEKILDSDAQEIQKDLTDPGMKEKLMEIEETEKRIEKILDSEAQEIQKDPQDPGMREKLMEIEETEKRIEKILDSDAEEMQKDHPDPGMKEKLMEIEETEKRIEKLLDSEGQENQKDPQDPGIREKLMEIEETEKRIEKILDSDTQELQKEHPDPGMKEKLMEIEETEKRIEKILDPETERLQKDITDSGMQEKQIGIEESEKRIKDQEIGMKEKLMEIEETEKRIEKILDPEVQGEEMVAGTMKEKLMEVEEAERRLKNVFDSTPGIEQSPNSAPKTPFIPEIPSEYVTSANQADNIENEEDDEPGTTPGDQPRRKRSATENESAEHIDSKTHQPEAQVEKFTLGTPDSLGNSYILTEGSPYDIPDSVTTVIIPERPMDTPSSDILEIVLEDDPEDGAKSIEAVGTKRREDSPEDESKEISLRNILDNFGEVVHQEAVLGPSSIDVDFIKNLKSTNDVVIPRKDLGLIAEEEDRDLAENATPEVANDPVLHDIAESEEALELEESEGKSGDPEAEDMVLEVKGASGVLEIGSPEALEPREDPEDLEKGDSLGTDEGHRASGSLEPEVGSPSTTAVGSLQQNATDSGTTESTDEVKETTISDDGGNTAAESSVTSPSCGEEIGPRNVSESSNEVKETTISDRPGEENGKNLFSLAPQCYGTMPHVPELNLDSLQDITVSSFQLSDDATAEEDSDVAQPHSENEHSVITANDDAIETQEHEPVNEEMIVAEKVLIEEDPCTKVTAYVEGPNPEDSEPKTAGTENVSSMENAGSFELGGTGRSDPEEILEHEIGKEVEETVEIVAEKPAEEVHSDEVVKDVGDKAPEEDPSRVNVEEVVEDAETKLPEEKHEALDEDDAERIHEDAAEDQVKVETEEEVEEVANKVPEEINNHIAEKESEEVREEAARQMDGNKNEKEPEEPAERNPEKGPEDEIEKLSEEKPAGVVEKLPGDVHEEKITGSSVTMDPEEGPEDLVPESKVSELETVSLNDFRALEASVGEEFLGDNVEEDVEEVDKVEIVSNEPAALALDPESDLKVEEVGSNSEMRVEPEVVGLTEPEEAKDASMTSGKIDDPVGGNLDPLKAEVTTNDLDNNDVHGDENNGERLEYHIYVPEVTASDEFSTTESSTFNSAATKIQAGVRGFLTRRRLQSAQRRSSTLDSVPSIQDSVAADLPHLEPIEEVGLFQAATTIQSNYRGYKARQRLRREDAVQKTTMSVESPFSGTGLQHTGEFHDCLPLPPFENDGRKTAADVFRPVIAFQTETDLDSSSAEPGEAQGHLEADGSQENREVITESTATTTTKEESAEDDSTLGLMVDNYPYAHQGLNLVLLSGSDAVLQSQYLNFITSIEEMHNEVEPLVQGNHPLKVIDAFSTLKSNAGIESLPLDNPETDTSLSAKEPLAIPGSPVGLIIEELSKTDEESSIPVDATSTSSTSHVKSVTNLDNDVLSEPQADDSLDLPGLSLEGKPTVTAVHVTKMTVGNDSSEFGKSDDVVEDTNVSLAPDMAQDASLGTMSFSMNVDDMLGLGAESDRPASDKMKPILEVTVTPRDLLKLTNRSQGSQASGDRVESPVTMMQFVPKSVEDKSDRSEDERETDIQKKSEEAARRENDIPEDTEPKVQGSPSVQETDPKASSNEDEDSSAGTSKTYSIGKN